MLFSFSTFSKLVLNCISLLVQRWESALNSLVFPQNILFQKVAPLIRMTVHFVFTYTGKSGRKNNDDTQVEDSTLINIFFVWWEQVKGMKWTACIYRGWRNGLKWLTNPNTRYKIRSLRGACLPIRRELHVTSQFLYTFTSVCAQWIDATLLGQTWRNLRI